MSVAVIAIAKLETDYINEWINQANTNEGYYIFYDIIFFIIS